MQNEEKKKNIIRIIIFLVLAFTPVYILGIIFIDENGNITNAFTASTVMLYPAFANVLTRIITKEGFKDSYIHANIKGNEKYYIAGVAYPIIAGIVSGLAVILFCMKDYSFSDMKITDTFFVLSSVMFSIVCAFVSILKGFGEEFGWRAYLTPKLEKLMPEPVAVIITGIIWALWHGPLLMHGYNFGNNDKFSPYSGFIAMIVMCIFLSSVLTWMTKRTKSVYPATICHILIDTAMSTIAQIMIIDKNGMLPEMKVSEFWLKVVVLVVPPMIFGTICFIFFKEGKSSDGLRTK